MMPAPVIRIQHARLLEQARAFDDEAGRVDGVLREMQAQRDTLQARGRWVGIAADAFYRRMDDEVLPGLRRLADSLRSGAEVTREIVRRLQAAEHDAQRLLAVRDAAGAARAAIRGAPARAPWRHPPEAWLLHAPLAGRDPSREAWERIPDLF